MHTLGRNIFGGVLSAAVLNPLACCPAMASDMGDMRLKWFTGRYQQRAGIEGVLFTNVEKTRKAGLQPEEVTFADVLSENGYDVAMFGKWHVGYLPQFGLLNMGSDILKDFSQGMLTTRHFWIRRTGRCSGSIMPGKR